MAAPPPARADAESPGRAAGAVLVLMFALFAFLLCVFPTRSMDAFWHLRTGERILAGEGIPGVDDYTYTEAGRPWIDLHWGFQVALAAVHGLGGTDLVVLAKAGVVAAAVLVLLLVGRGLSAASALPVLCLAAVVASGHAEVRPGVLTLLFLALFLVAAERFPASPPVLFALIPLQALWANCQGLFALGVAVAGAFVVDGLLRAAARGRLGLAPPATSPATLVALFAGVAVAPFANPWGIDGVLFPLELARKLTVDQEAYSIVLEFQRPLDFWRANGADWRALGPAFLGVQLALFAVAAASFVPLAARGRWSPLRALLFGAFTVLAWKMLRNSGPFAVVAAAVTLGNLRDARALAPPTRRPGARGPEGLATGLVGVGLVALLAWVATGASGRMAGDGRRVALGEPAAWFMHGPARFAAQEGFPAGAFVSHVGQAAVFVHAAGPERKVFMDGRLEVASRATFERFLEAARLMAESDPRFEELVRLPDGTLPSVLLDSRFSRAEINGLLALPERWRLVFADASGAVFLDVATADRLGLGEASVEPLEDPPLPV